ncbi:phytanoyl-CoA dioxygenase family protein [Chitinophaga polysaccharea]|uniref:phytanoyl-CoA dioxygenase family protein n=1 Tax=Chitinophaga TaxID=79328 RepID=UPI0014557DAD|nr:MULTISPECIES: phytanoyl-CoA dioxygenase family protein [Chitinophaga]NLR61361.1 phytanoyl-CoA dioxygenase family protein [Chitinophaga polysaccharea]NLU95196.1 phytanoyl-CoA dioxygenase family protein [Chitinophaga sp. Ak27]
MNTNNQPIFRLNEAINHTHLQYFRQHGIIQFKNYLDKNTLAHIHEEVARVQDFLLRNQVQKVNGIPLKFGADINGAPLIQRIAFASHFSNTLRELLKDQRLQSLIALLGPYSGRIGENEKDGLVINHYVNTAASQFKQLGWHTDSPRDLFLGSRILPMLNVGIHLDDCPLDNGGLRVLPGTHEQGLFKLLFRKKYFIDNNPDKKEVGFDIEAGDLTVHDGRLWHRVQQSSHTGEKSRRRVMYIPIITGDYQPKTANSPTPFYHKLAQFKQHLYGGKPQWVNVTAHPEKLAEVNTPSL